MKAIAITECGGPEKIALAELPTPKPASNEVLVKVKAAGLNHLDIWVRKGRPGVSFEKAHVLGSDAAGTIEAFGHGGKRDGLDIGQEVVINPGVSCMRCEFCLRGLHSECPNFKIVGFQLPGACAEFVAVPAANVFPRPAHLSWEEAAALPLAHITAFRMLFTRAQLQPGERLLIHGIGGGVALAALQFARACGAAAVVTSSCDEKLKRGAEMGAVAGINYKNTPDVAAEVLKVFGGRGVDVVLDSAGAKTLPISFAAVRRGGRIVTCGVTSGKEATVNLQQLYWNHISLLGSTMGSMEDMRRMLALVTSHAIKPVIDRTYALADYAQAIARMEDGLQFGKLVLNV
jgi:NADPH:quinone reductase-like Zn-dependent oxidoreductase